MTLFGQVSRLCVSLMFLNFIETLILPEFPECPPLRWGRLTTMLVVPTAQRKRVVGSLDLPSTACPVSGLRAVPFQR